jgi:hypothetical protein
LTMRREAPRVSFLMCPFCVRAPSSDLTTTPLDNARPATSGQTEVARSGTLRPLPLQPPRRTRPRSQPGCRRVTTKPVADRSGRGVVEEDLGDAGGLLQGGEVPGVRKRDRSRLVAATGWLHARGFATSRDRRRSK